MDVKICVVGDSQTGKTSMIAKYITGTKPPNPDTTCGGSFLTKETEMGGVKYNLLIWDTAGHPNYRSLLPMYYPDSKIAIFVFDITSRKSLDMIPEWVDEIHDKVGPDVIVSVCGNKSDLSDKRAMTAEQINEVVGKLDAEYFETSAETGEGIDELFSRSLSKFFYRNPPADLAADKVDNNSKSETSDAVREKSSKNDGNCCYIC